MPKILRFIGSKFPIFFHSSNNISQINYPSNEGHQSQLKRYSPNILDQDLQAASSFDAIGRLFLDNDSRDWRFVDGFLSALPSLTKQFEWKNFTCKKFFHNEVCDIFLEKTQDLEKAKNLPCPYELKSLENAIIKQDFFSTFHFLKEAQIELQSEDFSLLVSRIDLFIQNFIYFHNFLFLHDGSLNTLPMISNLYTFCSQLAKEYVWIQSMIFPHTEELNTREYNSKIFAVQIFSIDSVARQALKFYVNEIRRRADVGDFLLLNQNFTHMVSIKRIYGRAFDNMEISIDEEIHQGDFLIASMMDLVLNNENHPYTLIQHLMDESDNDRSLSLGTLQKLIRDLALGIQELHRKKLMHRDIKPDNILEGKDQFVITDWDLLIKVHHRRNNSHAGSKYYHAPEILKADFYDEKVDLFSFGATLYAAGELHFPYDDEDYAEDKFPSPFFEKIQDKDLQDLIIKLLKTDPKERGTIEEVLAHPFLSKKIEEDVSEDYFL